MEYFFIAYLDRLQALHNQIHEVLNELSDTAVNWNPDHKNNEMNSIAVLVTHAMGVERFWVGDVSFGDSSNRVRIAEFAVTDRSCAQLKTLLDETYEYVQTMLPQISWADLATLKTTPNHDRQFTVAWSILHALEHTAVHVGHIQIIRQLWEAQNL